MNDDETLVRLNFCLFKDGLRLKRTPKYLRFVSIRDGTSWQWDALDKLDDEPTPDEHIFAAILTETSSVHIDRVVVKGKRVGEWHKTATYDLIKEQPDEAILRNTLEWQRWCSEQVKAESNANNKETTLP